jgi:hypothetical protein
VNLKSRMNGSSHSKLTGFAVAALLVMAMFTFLQSSLPLIPEAKAEWTVGTSIGTMGATIWGYQRKCFYANGLFWVFYCDGSNVIYKTSSTGSSWSNPTTVRSSGFQGDYLCVWFNGTYMCYGFTTMFNNTALYYRAGTPNANGSISWLGSEQTAVAAMANATYNDITVAIDNNGYAWAGYRLGNVTTGAVGYPYVTKSQWTNGTWGTAPSGFPYELNSATSADWCVSVIPLTDGKMLAMYGGSKVYARSWNGSSWSKEVSTTSSLEQVLQYSAVAIGDNVGLVFTTTPTSNGTSQHFNINYTLYSYSSNSFGAESIVQSFATPTTTITPDMCPSPVLSLNIANNNLYCFWANNQTVANHIYYKQYTSATSQWDTSQTDWITEVQLFNNHTLSSFYSGNNLIGLEYMNRTTSPYQIRFDYLNLTTSFSPRANVHLLLTVEPNQATYMRSQSLTLDVSVLNRLNPSLNSTLTLTVTSPDGYYYFDFQRVNVTANGVGEYSFAWDVPDVAGTYAVEVSLIPPQLTAYDAAWLKAS